MTIIKRPSHSATRRIQLILFLGLLWIPIVSTTQAQIIGKNDTVILDRIIAVVGHYPILQSELEVTVGQQMQEQMPFDGDPICQVLEGLLVNKLMVNQAEIDSVEVTDEEVERTLNNKLQTFILQAGSQENLEKMFKKTLAEIKKDFFKPQKEMMLVQRMSEEISKDVKITPSEVRRFFNKIPDDKIPLRPETVEIRQISIKPSISEAEKKRVINQLNEMRDRIMKGEISMASLAGLYSEDPGSASHGGELGLMPRNGFDPDFAAAAFNLKGSEVSRPVKSEFGYHIIQTIDRRGDYINARHILLRPKSSAEEKVAVRLRLDSIANFIREGKMTFDQAVIRFSEDEETRNNGGLIVVSAGQQSEKNITRIPLDQLAPDLFQAVKDLKAGEISEVFESKDKTQSSVYKIVMVKTRTPAHKAGLNSDYDFIQQQALGEKNQAAVDEWIEKKLKSIYVRIDPDYQNCEFHYQGWRK